MPVRYQQPGRVWPRSFTREAPVRRRLRRRVLAAAGPPDPPGGWSDVYSRRLRTRGGEFDYYQARRKTRYLPPVVIPVSPAQILISGNALFGLGVCADEEAVFALDVIGNASFGLTVCADEEVHYGKP